MAEWSMLEREWENRERGYDPYPYTPFYEEPFEMPSQCHPSQAQPNFSPPMVQNDPFLFEPQLPLPQTSDSIPHQQNDTATVLPRENPREIRNKAEKQRRDKINQSIADLTSMVPPVVGYKRKIDKTGVLRLTAHYLRAHQYVFGDSLGKKKSEINSDSALTLLRLLNGFLLTTTYKGVIVVASHNVQQYLGYPELDLLGQSIFNITHPDDHPLLKEQLSPKSSFLGQNGELLPQYRKGGKQNSADILSSGIRRFVVRFKKSGQRSAQSQYVVCHVEGSLRIADQACKANRSCPMMRRPRTRGDYGGTAGNDVVFIGMVRPTTETFITESEMESFRMEYRTRHSIDGGIIQCEQRIALVTGYMMQEVNGVNAMNFMHKDDVRWVIIALREMYDQNRLFGESCYRLMTKNGHMIYMRTRGKLEVDHESKVVTTFVCTNTVVDEDEGKQLIRLMKKKFSLLVNDNEEMQEEDEVDEVSDNQVPLVEHPRQLEKVILHLVTNLPSPQPEETSRGDTPERGDSTSPRLAIIPPRKERIVSAIKKIYGVIKTFKQEPDTMTPNQQLNEKNNLKPCSQQTIMQTKLELEQMPPRSLLRSIQHIFPPAPTVVSQPRTLAPAKFIPPLTTESRPLCRISDAVDKSQKLPIYNCLFLHKKIDSSPTMTTNAMVSANVPPPGLKSEFGNLDSDMMPPTNSSSSILPSAWPMGSADPSESWKNKASVNLPLGPVPPDNDPPDNQYWVASNISSKALSTPKSLRSADLHFSTDTKNTIKTVVKASVLNLGPEKSASTNGAGTKRPHETRHECLELKRKNKHDTPNTNADVDNYFGLLDSDFLELENELEQHIDPEFSDLLLSSDLEVEVDEILAELKSTNQEVKDKQ